MPELMPELMSGLMSGLMFLWRISNHSNLEGLGAERSDGRWHTAAPGKRIVYLAEHPAVAFIENLANLNGDPSFFPEHFQLLKIAVPKASLMRVKALAISRKLFHKFAVACEHPHSSQNRV